MTARHPSKGVFGTECPDDVYGERSAARRQIRWVLAHYSPNATEDAVKRRLGAPLVDREALAAVGNLYRAAAAVRRHLENSALRSADLTWSAFVVLWVVWVWEEIETRHVAAEAGISKGTLTGIIKGR